MVTMTVYSEVKRLYSSLQEMVGLRRRKRQLQNSEPFNFKKETTILPGLTEDEITVLREKAAASRLGIAHAEPFAYTDTPAFLTHHHPSSTRLPSRLAPGPGGGPLSLSPPPQPQLRLSTPLPIPIPNVGGNPSSRHGSGTSSLRSCSTASGMAVGMGAGAWAGAGGYYLQPGGGNHQGVKSVSMNDLDLLLFGDPSIHTPTAPAPPYHQGRMGMGMGRETELVMPLPIVSAVTKAAGGGGGGGGGGASSLSSGMISPLELDDGYGGGGGGGGRMDWDMEFDFQLGSPVSPLSPADGGRKGFM